VVLASILVPAVNEASHMSDCLRAVLAQTVPLHEMEVIVVVGGASEDATESIARSQLAAASLARGLVVRNSTSSTPSNLNVALAHASAPFVCRVDARSRIAPRHVERCVEVLSQRPDVAVVGGAQVAVPPTGSVVGLGIARALNNPLGMGGSRYRRNAGSGFCETVYLGAFRREELVAAGGWNEAFPTNQDFELNQRLRGEGQGVWFDESIPAGYVPRSSLGELFGQYRRFGRAKVRYWRQTGDRPQRRQLALLAVPPLTIATAVLAHRLLDTGGGRSAAGGALLVAAMGVERASTGPREVLVRSRVVHLAALAAVSAGWEVGAYEELCFRRTTR